MDFLNRENIKPIFKSLKTLGNIFKKPKDWPTKVQLYKVCQSLDCTKWVAERAHLHILEREKEVGSLGGLNTSLERMGMSAQRQNNTPKPLALTYTLIMWAFWKQA